MSCGHLGIGALPAQNIPDGLVQIQQAVIIEPIENARGNHLGGRSNQGNPVQPKGAKRAMVQNTPLSMNDNQPGARKRFQFSKR